MVKRSRETVQKHLRDAESPSQNQKGYEAPKNCESILFIYIGELDDLKLFLG